MLENIKLEDLKEYYNENFKFNISYLAFIGDINVDEVRMLAEIYFGKWEKGNVVWVFYFCFKVLDVIQVVLINKDGVMQLIFNIIYLVNLKFGMDDVIVVNVLNIILGGGLLFSCLN